MWDAVCYSGYCGYGWNPELYGYARWEYGGACPDPPAVPTSIGIEVQTCGGCTWRVAGGVLAKNGTCEDDCTGYLYLGNNRIAEIADGALAGLPLVTGLSLGSNDVRALPERAFAGLPLLEVLNLEHNPLGAGLAPTAFANISSALQILGVGGTGLGCVPAGDIPATAEISGHDGHEYIEIPRCPAACSARCIGYQASGFDGAYGGMDLIDGLFRATPRIFGGRNVYSNGRVLALFYTLNSSISTAEEDAVITNLYADAQGADGFGYRDSPFKWLADSVTGTYSAWHFINETDSSEAIAWAETEHGLDTVALVDGAVYLASQREGPGWFFSRSTPPFEKIDLGGAGGGGGRMGLLTP